MSGNRRVTTDLHQEGLEAPCFHTFVGASKKIEKLKMLAASTPDSAILVVEPPSKKGKINTSDTASVSKDQRLGAVRATLPYKVKLFLDRQIPSQHSGKMPQILKF